MERGKRQNIFFIVMISIALIGIFSFGLNNKNITGNAIETYDVYEWKQLNIQYDTIDLILTCYSGKGEIIQKYNFQEYKCSRIYQSSPGINSPIECNQNRVGKIIKEYDQSGTTQTKYYKCEKTTLTKSKFVPGKTLDINFDYIETRPFNGLLSKVPKLVLLDLSESENYGITNKILTNPDNQKKDIISNPLNPSIIKGKIGNAINLTGNKASYFLKDEDHLYKNEEGLTISFWIKSNKENEGYLIKKEGSYGINKGKEYFTFQTNNMDGSLSGNELKYELLENKWTYLTFIISTKDNQKKLYVNGNLNTQSTYYNKIPNLENSNVITLGGYFKGSIDELKIYNRELTTKEIKNLYMYNEITPPETPEIIIPQCGSANGGTYERADSLLITNACSPGKLIGLFEDESSGKFKWTCMGSGITSPIDCSANINASKTHQITCGNGIKETGEQCDKVNGCGTDCKCKEGYFGSTLHKQNICNGITITQTKCGNNIVDEGEECDGGKYCYSFASMGELGCTCQPGYERNQSSNGCQKIPTKTTITKTELVIPECGPSKGMNFSSVEAIVGNGACSKGELISINLTNENTKWKWTCMGSGIYPPIYCYADAYEVIPKSNDDSTTNSEGSSNGGGSNGITTPITDSQLKRGYTKENMREGDRLRFKIDGKYHYVIIEDIKTDRVKLEVRSNPKTAIIYEEDSEKFELNDDDYYDLLITIEEIHHGKVDLTIEYLHELINPQEIESYYERQSTYVEQEEAYNNTNPEEDNTDFWIYMTIGIISAILLVVILIYLAFRRKSKEMPFPTQ